MYMYNVYMKYSRLSCDYAFAYLHVHVGVPEQLLDLPYYACTCTCMLRLVHVYMGCIWR